MDRELITELELTKTLLTRRMNDLVAKYKLSKECKEDLIEACDMYMDITFHKFDPTIEFGSFKKWDMEE